jgi:hypothetical protein
VNTFEYVSIAYALVFSATALRLIGGLPHALNRDRSYWVHTAFVVLILIGTALNFWTFLAYRETDWNLARFGLLLLTPGVLYFIACSAVPDDPGSVESWKSFYYAKRTQFFAGLVGWGLITTLNTTVLLEMPALHPTRFAQLGLLVLGVSGLSSGRHTVHRTIVFVAVGVVAIAIVVFFTPGSMAR